MEQGLKNLEIYRISLQVSEKGWQIFKILPKQFQFSIGEQFLTSCDSIGANIAEGYGRFHYKDKIRFYYNARGSLWEAKHWLLLWKRNFITTQLFETMLQDLEDLGKKLNSFIQKTGKKNVANDQ